MLTGAFSARAAVAKSLPYDPIRDFAFITLVSAYPMVVATAPNSPIASFADLIARAKAAPFSITYGMNLPGSVHHLTGELINIEAGISLRGIPYRGNTQIVQDLLGGRLDVMIETGTIAFAQINGGTLRGLAVSSRRRFVLEPDIPAHRRDPARLRSDVMARPCSAGRDSAAHRRAAQSGGARDP
jgi:tripartite-type tricarboxylate transporter receptor subunit TctC